jgi:hypothetical protein
VTWEAVVTGPMSVYPPVQAHVVWHWRDGQGAAGLAGVAGYHSAKLRRMESTGANTPSRAAFAPRPSFSTRLDPDFAFWAVVVHSLDRHRHVLCKERCAEIKVGAIKVCNCLSNSIARGVKRLAV